MKILLRVIIVLGLTFIARSAYTTDPVVTVSHYAMDSSTSSVFNPLSIPRWQICPLADSGHVVFYNAGYLNKAVTLTFGLDSSQPWVSYHTGALSDLDHAHLSVHNDTVIVSRSNNSTLQAYTPIGDSLTQLWTWTWPYSEADVYVPSIQRLPNSDTCIAISRGLDDAHAIAWWISSNKGQSFVEQGYMVNRIGTGRCRIGLMVYGQTVAAVVDTGDYAIEWWTFNRSSLTWVREGKIFNRSMYRGMAGNVAEDSIQFLIGTRDLSTGDSIIWAWKNQGDVSFVEGTGFKTSNVGQSLPPYTALTYIESSRRLVLFYSDNDSTANDDYWTVFCRWMKMDDKTWSAPTRVSRGTDAWKVVTAMRVPESHGDVAYAMIPFDTLIGATTYHLAGVVKVEFDDPDVSTTRGNLGKIKLRKGKL
ncbi:hypothetical protein C4561_01535 [candidate division WWE3 bacterium]|uniref:Exo-alpha-sialidase n=1 Tax=candidate division WWE3 bacterium TaxID=2053526 RepID=A0A3A4ZF12_UNCKA|nr:MAG: hypothetical protein C4561_01535 [candidate division WWE3 bacterium]